MGDRRQIENGRRDGHLVVYVMWPLLGGLLLGAVFGLAAFGLLLMGGGEGAHVGAPLQGWARVAWAGRWAVGVFLVVDTLVTGSVFLYALQSWAGPGRIAQMQQTERIVEVAAPVVEGEYESPLIFRPYGARAIPANVDLEVQGLEPGVRPDVRDLYRFLVAVWPTGNVAREHCARLGFGRAQWERYVGGRRGMEGQESGRGLLERAGAVYRDQAGRWQMTPGASLEQVLGINEELRVYAEGKARLVRLGRDRPDGTGQGRGTDPGVRGAGGGGADDGRGSG